MNMKSMKLKDILALQGLKLNIHRVHAHSYYWCHLTDDTIIEYAHEWVNFDESELDFCNPISFIKLVELGLVESNKVDPSKTMVALRIKGDTRVHEGWLIDIDMLDIAVHKADDSIIGCPFNLVDAIWYCGQWMDTELFMTLG